MWAQRAGSADACGASAVSLLGKTLVKHLSHMVCEGHSAVWKLHHMVLIT